MRHRRQKQYNKKKEKRGHDRPDIQDTERLNLRVNVWLKCILQFLRCVEGLYIAPFGISSLNPTYHCVGNIWGGHETNTRWLWWDGRQVRETQVLRLRWEPFIPKISPLTLLMVTRVKRILLFSSSFQGIFFQFIGIFSLLYLFSRSFRFIGRIALLKMFCKQICQRRTYVIAKSIAQGRLPGEGRQPILCQPNNFFSFFKQILCHSDTWCVLNHCNKPNIRRSSDLMFSGL